MPSSVCYERGLDGNSGERRSAGAPECGRNSHGGDRHFTEMEWFGGERHFDNYMFFLSVFVCFVPDTCVYLPWWSFIPPSACVVMTHLIHAFLFDIDVC